MPLLRGEPREASTPRRTPSTPEVRWTQLAASCQQRGNAPASERRKVMSLLRDTLWSSQPSTTCAARSKCCPRRPPRATIHSQLTRHDIVCMVRRREKAPRWQGGAGRQRLRADLAHLDIFAVRAATSATRMRHMARVQAFARVARVCVLGVSGAHSCRVACWRVFAATAALRSHAARRCAGELPGSGRGWRATWGFVRTRCGRAAL